MSVKRHKNDTKTFDELTFSEQAKSINGQIISLEKSINAHIIKSKAESRDYVKTLLKCIGQISRLINRFYINFNKLFNW